MMRKNILLPLLLLLITLLTGVCCQKFKEMHVKAGEMVHLQCPQHRRSSALIWTSHTEQGMTIHMLSAESMPVSGVLIHGRSLVILSASVNHQGNYSCSLRNASRLSWFRLTVHAETREDDNRSTYPMTCYTEEACTMECPSPNIPMKALNITTQDVIWHKEGESEPKPNYFSRVQETDQGVYTCTRSYLYDGHLYNMTFISELSVKPSNKVVKSARINSPRMGEIFVVDLGLTVVIDCKAVMYSDFDEVFWLSGDSFVKKDSNLPVFYNYTRESTKDEINMIVSLIFRKVSEEDLSKTYTCKLETEHESSSFVTITLDQRVPPPSLPLALGCVIVTLVLIVAVVVYVKLKVDGARSLRDTLSCYHNTSDGKSYDIFLMDAGLNEDERTWLRDSLEENYRLCLYDRDISPEKAATKAVLDCIKQSRTIVWVPTSEDLGPGPELLSAMHEALEKRQTHLILIKTDDPSTSRSIPEVLQHHSNVVNSVTWKGAQDSSFLEQLRVYLPALQQTQKTRLSP